MMLHIRSNLENTILKYFSEETLREILEEVEEKRVCEFPVTLSHPLLLPEKQINVKIYHEFDKLYYVVEVRNNRVVMRFKSNSIYECLEALVIDVFNIGVNYNHTIREWNFFIETVR